MPDTPTAVEASSKAAAQPQQADSKDYQDAPAASETQPVDVKENGSSPPSQESEPTPPRSAPAPAPAPVPQRPSLDDQQRRASSFSDRRDETSTPRRASISTTNTHVDELEVYIGDATWEERTWKVLVRLREDMFYARLGSVR